MIRGRRSAELQLRVRGRLVSRVAELWCCLRRGANRLRQGYGGPPKLHAKAQAPRSRVIAAIFASCLLVLAFWIRLGPIPADLLDERGSISTIVTDRRGVVLYEALSGEGTRSVRLDSEHLPT